MLSKLSLCVGRFGDRGYRRRVRQRPTRVVQVLAGQRAASGGKIMVRGETTAAVRHEMRRHRFHVLPEMPLHNACVGNMTVAENLAFRVFDQPPLTRLKKLVKRRCMKSRAVGVDRPLPHPSFVPRGQDRPPVGGQHPTGRAGPRAWAKAWKC